MSGENILLVEDEENLVEALRFSLTREGYQVMVASDGEQGLLKARQESPDLVLLDIILPKMDGVEVCRLLRQETQVPILMLTAKDLPGLWAATDRAGQLVDARVTIIGADGQVLADTWQPPGDLANQAGQPEVREALGSGLGRVARADSPADTSTSGELLYTASPIRRGERLFGVGRIGVPTSRIDANLKRVIASVSVGGFVVAVIAIGMGLYIARRGSRSVRYVAAGARRFAEGNLDPPLHVTGADETRELAEAFNYMAGSLQSSIRNLTEERNKLSVVLEVMADGVIVIGPDRRATLLNPAARELLGVADTGANGVNLEDLVSGAWLAESSGISLKWVPLYPDLRRLIADCFEQRERQHADLELYRPHRVVSAVATPLGGGSDPPGVLLTLHDLTRIRQVERSQQEFVSNVSHELRNPLAAMKAMVETLEDGALQETDIASDFLQRLHREIDRGPYWATTCWTFPGSKAGNRSWTWRRSTCFPWLRTCSPSLRISAAARA